MIIKSDFKDMGVEDNCCFLKFISYTWNNLLNQPPFEKHKSPLSTSCDWPEKKVGNDLIIYILTLEVVTSKVVSCGRQAEQQFIQIQVTEPAGNFFKKIKLMWNLDLNYHTKIFIHINFKFSYYFISYALL